MKKNSSRYNNEFISKQIITIYFSIIAFKYLTGYSELLFTLPFLGAILFIFIFHHLNKEKFLILFTVWLTAFILMSLYSAQDNDFRSIYYLLIGFSSFAVGFTLYIFPKYSLRLSFWMLVIFYFFIIGAVALGDGASSLILNELFPGSSRNIVGAMAVFIQIFYSASYYRLNKKLPQVFVWITLVIIFLAFGRSSIAAGVILLFAHIVFLGRRKVKTSVFIIMLITILISLSGAFMKAQEYIEYNTNFNKGIESSRSEIIKEYLSTTTGKKLVLGHPISDSQTALSLNGNPHNSYIRMHSYYGIVGVLFLCSVLMVLVLRVNKHNFIYVIFILIYLFRVFFEPLALFDIYDFLLFYLLSLIYFSSGVTIPRGKVC